jgi:hypothetical protein
MLLSRVANDREIDAVHILRLWEHRGWVKFSEPVRQGSLVVGQLRVAVEQAASELKELAQAAEERSRDAEMALVRELEAEEQMAASDRKRKKVKRKSKDEPRDDRADVSDATTCLLSGIYSGADAALSLASDSVNSRDTAESFDSQPADTETDLVADAILSAVYQRSAAVLWDRLPSTVTNYIELYPVEDGSAEGTEEEVRKTPAAKRQPKEKRKKSKEAPRPLLSYPAPAPAELKRPFEGAVDKSDSLHRRDSICSTEPEEQDSVAHSDEPAAEPAISSEHEWPRKSLLATPAHAATTAAVEPLARHAVTGGLLPVPQVERTASKTSASQSTCDSCEPVEIYVEGFSGSLLQMERMPIEMALDMAIDVQDANFECMDVSWLPMEEEPEEEDDSQPAPGMLYERAPLMQSRAPRRSRGGKGRKAAGSPASSYSGMAFSYAVSSSAPAATAPPVTPTARRASVSSGSHNSNVSPHASTFSPAFSPADRFSGGSFDGFVPASPQGFQPENFGPSPPQPLDSFSPQGIPMECFSPQGQSSAQGMESFSPQKYPGNGYNSLEVFTPASPANVYAPPTSPQVGLGQGCSSPIFAEVVKLMAGGNLEQRLRQHENVPYED